MGAADVVPGFLVALSHLFQASMRADRHVGQVKAKRLKSLEKKGFYPFGVISTASFSRFVRWYFH